MMGKYSYQETSNNQFMAEKSLVGTVARGIRMPVFREGDDLATIVTDNILTAAAAGEFQIRDHDVIAITESVVARTEGNYVSVDDIAESLREQFGDNVYYRVLNPIYSRNRFAMILKGIARAANEKVCLYMPDEDEVGNVCHYIGTDGTDCYEHPVTKVNYRQYYKEIIEGEGKKCRFVDEGYENVPSRYITIDCSLRPAEDLPKWGYITLSDICNKKNDKHGYNEEYGLLGSNKATEELLKLFPKQSTCEEIVENVRKQIKEETGKNVEVMIYGDGAYKDPSTGIWEFADPVVSPAHTKALDGHPCEIKLKAFADDEFRNLRGEELTNAVKEKVDKAKNYVMNKMESQGTTPRKFCDLLGSLADLVSGSGDKGTPVVLIQGYFDKYCD